ncbi:cupin domain-containing protein [Aquabacterium sp.]|uniref:(R)-mandelonitrile lyase n=1 Tax=Aquabacterium sp. TaxID=1872578 RepID=UPI0025BCFE3C|nr:cupin domain-containing protein [Aquabacterium sp.]
MDKLSVNGTPSNPTRSAAALLACCLAVGEARAVEAPQTASDTLAPLVLSRAGSTPSIKGQVPANFTGTVRIDMLHAAQAPWHASAAYVTFEPGARTVWHTHPVGQTLVVTAGVGRVQREGGPVETIRPGDVVWIPAGVKHWHGAGPSTGMTHMAITETQDGQNVTWLEPVSDAQYAK